MRNYFIYQYEDLVSSKDKLRITVIFVHQSRILSQNVLADEIDAFFHENSITDKLVVLIPDYLDDESLKYFFESRDLTFVRVPGKSSDYFEKSLIIYRFNSSGRLSLIYGTATENDDKFRQ